MVPSLLVAAKKATRAANVDGVIWVYILQHCFTITRCVYIRRSLYQLYIGLIGTRPRTEGPSLCDMGLSVNILFGRLCGLMVIGRFGPVAGNFSSLPDIYGSANFKVDELMCIFGRIIPYNRNTIVIVVSRATTFSIFDSCQRPKSFFPPLLICRSRCHEVEGLVLVLPAFLLFDAQGIRSPHWKWDNPPMNFSI